MMRVFPRGNLEMSMFVLLWFQNDHVKFWIYSPTGTVTSPGLLLIITLLHGKIPGVNPIQIHVFVAMFRKYIPPGLFSQPRTTPRLRHPQTNKKNLELQANQRRKDFSQRKDHSTASKVNPVKKNWWTYVKQKTSTRGSFLFPQIFFRRKNRSQTRTNVSNSHGTGSCLTIREAQHTPLKHTPGIPFHTQMKGVRILSSCLLPSFELHVSSRTCICSKQHQCTDVYIYIFVYVYVYMSKWMFHYLLVRISMVLYHPKHVHSCFWLAKIFTQPLKGPNHLMV